MKLQTAVDGREKAQNAKDKVETVVAHSVKMSVSAKLFFPPPSLDPTYDD
jgi:hypothetical protein